MTRLITGLEVHRYAPELNMSHSDYINLSRLYRGRMASLTDLPEHLTRLRQRHNVPGTIIHTHLRYR